MRRPSKTPLAAMAALAALVVLPACAPGLGPCSPQSSRLDRNYTTASGNEAKVHPVMATAAVAITGACVLAGHRYG